jgi:hypothetical protein
MKQAVALMCLCLALSQSRPLGAEEENSAPAVNIPNDAIGQRCIITLQSATLSSITTDSGKVVRFDKENVVLSDATRTVRVNKSIPVLGSIPYVGRLFRNVGLGAQDFPGEHTIPRREIKSAKFTE